MNKTTEKQSYYDIALQLYGNADAVPALLATAGLATETAAGETDLSDALQAGQLLPEPAPELVDRATLRALAGATIATL